MITRSSRASMPSRHDMRPPRLGVPLAAPAAMGLLDLDNPCALGARAVHRIGERAPGDRSNSISAVETRSSPKCSGQIPQTTRAAAISGGRAPHDRALAFLRAYSSLLPTRVRPPCTMSYSRLIVPVFA
jgi:hypothetical protein